MTTNQKQTSTAGQKLTPVHTGRPIAFNPTPLGRKENFSFKNCKTWNQYRQTGVTQYIRGEIDPGYTGCAILDIPDDPHPWNALRSVADQFYQRERDIAWERYESREAIKKAQRLEEQNKQLDNARWILDSRIGELKRELTQARDKIAELESNQPAGDTARLDLLDDILRQCDAWEWVDNIGEALDSIIALAHYDEVSHQSLYTVRRLQEFFMRLDKATDHDVDNRKIRPEGTATASKNI